MKKCCGTHKPRPRIRSVTIRFRKILLSVASWLCGLLSRENTVLRINLDYDDGKKIIGKVGLLDQLDDSPLRGAI